MSTSTTMSLSLMEFKCSACGACCVLAGRLGLMPADPVSGSCIHLDPLTQSCLIYETRPDICRVDVMYRKRYHEMTKTEYYKANTLLCHQLIDTLQLDPSYKLDPTEYDT